GGLCTFPTAADGAEAAMEMQRSVQQRATLADIGVESLAIRAGFHNGSVILERATFLATPSMWRQGWSRLPSPDRSLLQNKPPRGWRRVPAFALSAALRLRGRASRSTCSRSSGITRI